MAIFFLHTQTPTHNHHTHPSPPEMVACVERLQECVVILNGVPLSVLLSVYANMLPILFVLNVVAHLTKSF